jgi:nicotinamidase-related amidase
MPLAKRSEKGLLTPDNCVITLIDHQPQMLFGVTSIDRQTLINNVVGFSKAAKLFNVPVVLTTVETRAFSGNLWPQLAAQFPNRTPIERSSMNSWDDRNFVEAVKASGKKKVLLAGLWTQVCVTFPTLQAIADGYEIYVVEDLCGDLDLRTHDAAMRRCEQAGARPVTWIQVMLEWQRDWALRETYAGVMDIVKSHGGAYGMGVEYAYTMVHNAPPTNLPNWLPPAAESH